MTNDEFKGAPSNDSDFHKYRTCHENSLKIKNLENLVSIFNDRLLSINNSMVRTSTLIDEIINSTLSLKIGSIEKNYQSVVVTTMSNSKAIDKLEKHANTLAEAAMEIKAMSTSITDLLEDIAESKDKIATSITNISIISERQKTNISKLSKIEKDLEKMDPLRNIITIIKMVAAIIAVGVTVTQGIKYLAKIEVLNLF